MRLYGRAQLSPKMALLTLSAVFLPALLQKLSEKLLMIINFILLVINVFQLVVRICGRVLSRKSLVQVSRRMVKL